jgi:hypothetical protein
MRVEGVRNVMRVKPATKVAAGTNRHVPPDDVLLPAEQQPALEDPNGATEVRVVRQVKDPKSGHLARIDACDL